MRKYCILTCTLLSSLLFFQVNGQEKKQRIAVIGSSTAYGYFKDEYPREEGFVFKLEKYYQDLGLVDKIDNYAKNGKDCYDGMPTGYLQPDGRNPPDPTCNITRAVNGNPRPDVIIVNYPSNSYNFLSDGEIIFCLDSIMKYANANGIRCYITTSQPRDAFHNGCRQKEIRDVIMSHFGKYAIDFFTDVATEDCKIKPEFALGDGVHLNPAGQSILFDKVIEKNILFDVVGLEFIEFKAANINGVVTLSWRINGDSPAAYFRIMRSTDGVHFSEAGKVDNSNTVIYTFADHAAGRGRFFYRIEGVYQNGRPFYSKVIAAVSGQQDIEVGRIFINGNRIRAEIANTTGKPVSVSMFDMNGRLIFNDQKRPGNNIYEKDISSFCSGLYSLVVSYDGKRIRQTLIRK